MVRYRELVVPPITGAFAGPVDPFRAWQPSTWPNAPARWDNRLSGTIRRIFEESIFLEIDNVISDAGGDLEHRGHVVGIALLCALDAVSSYGYGRRNGRQIVDFVPQHFPVEFHPFAGDLVTLYRNAMIHSWNLFKAYISPGNEPITRASGTFGFGLLTFRNALYAGMNDYLTKLDVNTTLQQKTLRRYRELKASARA
jgi:hypothetical protein